MASISGFGNVGGSEGYKRPSGVSKPAAEANPQVGTDGFVGSFSAPVVEQHTAPVANTPVKAQQAPTRSSVPVTLSFDEGMAINGLGSSERVGLSAFTNGLGSNTIVGLSGKVLAGSNPFTNHQ